MPDASDLIHRAIAARVGEPPHPLLLLLHGRGADEADLLGLAPHLDARFFVVSARAPYQFDRGGGFAWYESLAPGRPDATTFRASLCRLSAFVRELAASYPIDPAAIYPLGFSQGSMMANALTLTAPDLVAGAVLLSGFQPAIDGLTVQREALRGKPVFAAHGTFDEVLPVAMGQRVENALLDLSLDLTYREYAMGHQIIGPELADFDSWLKARLDARST
jgi:phospholipase/carboxylesterase